MERVKGGRRGVALKEGGKRGGRAKGGREYRGGVAGEPILT